MKNLWDKSNTFSFEDDLDARVYSSRLLGQDSSLVLHGGGNTSVKILEKNLLGDEEQILYVKGSGWDLVSIERAGFSPVRMSHMVSLAKLESLSDPEMVNELKTQLTDANAPAPSVETILHAILPFKFVDHTHADSVVTISNTSNGEERIKEIYGDKVLVVPYVMPGFDLAKSVDKIFSEQATSLTEGIILMNHGIFSFGNSAKESYDRMIDLVADAENYIHEQNAWDIQISSPPSSNESLITEIPKLRQLISKNAKKPLLLNLSDKEIGVHFSKRPDLKKIANQGPLTPDHVIRTKRVPMIGRDVEKYIKEYTSYFDHNVLNAKESKTMLDPLPRIVIDSEFGVCSIGKNMKEVGIVSDIYEHTMLSIIRAEKLGGFKALPSSDIFDLEYWDLEQAKLKKNINSFVFEGEVVLITGAASGIGRACVESFLNRGSAVIGLDIDSSIKEVSNDKNYLGIICNLTNDDELKESIELAVRYFGGIDMAVLNAGIFPPAHKVSELPFKEWRSIFSINLDANFNLLRLIYPILKLAPNSGRVVFIGSKNVPAPGPGAAAYSASKAALNQLMRVLSMEWGEDGIRLNTVHPNAVFDTGIWTEEVLKSRAENYGLSVDEYKSNNLLKIEISSFDVSELAAEMCGPLFSRTTAAQVSVDGGNERVI
ncbi:bifunctional aldolase/short-chain dehydrogenase [Candidatus Pseudothioglobus singularis]|jgi:rhamnose utilization protein RhaD (predicted bifunctional aldolase and dehydrogenase)/NAD(P)-dependent dehydrogenase (short-subunit alcohol dehydrogenase family)|uniref:Short-chain dehydrogenase n=1 Tax=Candidatus Pseudothioglobus singularis PS1 TaxID=1125411 RepID=A0A0M3T272_9GAMM|nr:bifunctional aldolase/short-chain dehydrogenase [Candidatus Pseudothioglobus singularis]ALE02311.1 short-chain dehydrogenase [Candidatus Pseudothioglobus singularis PS1]